MIPFGTGYVAVNQATTTSSVSANTYKNEAGTDLSWNDYATLGQAARGNLYITTADGVRKIPSIASGSVAYRAGLRPPMVLLQHSTTTSARAVPSNMSVAYRALVETTDANGVVTQSMPSGRLIFYAPGADRNPTLRVALFDTTANGNQTPSAVTVRLYRTVSNTPAEPDDYCYLVKSVAVTSGNYIDILDNVSDGELGEALYTNPDVGTAAAAHIMPPVAGCMGLYNGSLWLGDLTFPCTGSFSYLNKSTGATSDSIGGHTLTGTFANGSPTCTVADSSLFKVHQMATYVSGWPWVSAGPAYISAIPDATHITFSQNWGGGNGVQTFDVADVIKVGSTYYPNLDPETLGAFIRGVALGTGGRQLGTLAAGDANLYLDAETDLATASNLPHAATGMQATIRFTAFNPAAAAPVIYATNGASYSPALPEPTATGYTLPQEIQPDGVMWSNALEPEHFQTGNMDHIGDGAARVMAMENIGQSLLIFTDKGLHRANGYVDSGVSLTRIDTDVKLLTNYCTCVIGNKAYAWGDRSVYQCTETAASPITQTNLSLSTIQQLIGPGSKSAAGAFMFANTKEGEVVLSVPSVSYLGYGERLYVYNQNQQAWTNWFTATQLLAGCYYTPSTTGKVGLATRVGSAYWTWEERAQDPSGAGIWTADTDYTITIATAVGTAITYTGGTGWTPIRGDLIVQNNTRYYVQSYNAGVVTVHKAGLNPAPNVPVYVGFTFKVTPVAFTANNPTTRKAWGEGSICWSELYGVLHYTLAFASPVSFSGGAVPAERVLSDDISTDTSGRKADATRFTVPRAAARSSRIYPVISVRQAGSLFGIEAIMLKYQVMSDRTRTKLG
jgi:hypothetical protein